jgi:hypothetical protein
MGRPLNAPNEAHNLSNRKVKIWSLLPNTDFHSRSMWVTVYLRLLDIPIPSVLDAAQGVERHDSSAYFALSRSLSFIDAFDGSLISGEAPGRQEAG